MTAKIEIFDTTKLNYAGYGPIGVYVNIGYEPLPEGYKTLPDSQFDSYKPDPGYLKNTGLRTPLFTGGFISSPLLVDGSYEYLVDSQGYYWLYNTFNYMAVSPFRRELYPVGITPYSAALYAPPPEGSIQIIVNDKNQSQTFLAKNENGSSIDYYFATDENGNKFILGSIDAAYAEDPSVPFGDAVFPSGWSKSIEPLNADLTIYPAYGDGNRRIYNQFRDNLTNNYFQISFAANGKGIAREVPGLALSGGNENDRILGTSLSEELYGARGSDTLIGVEGNDRIWGDDGDDLLIPGKGDNSLWGGAGLDTFFISQQGVNTIFDFSLDDGDILRLGSSRYSLIDTADGVQITGNNLSITLVLGIFANDLVAGQNIKYPLTGSNVPFINIETVRINDEGNQADTNGYGRVDANYSIGKYEITVEQYCVFLNAVAASDPYRLYNPGLMTSALNAGINRSGTDGSYSYSPVSGTEQFPITGVSWFDAARFANWLANGQPLGPCGPSTTENGAYNLNGKLSGQSVSRNSANPNTGTPVSFALPTENEWYKAAYYNPKLNNDKGGYYTYATQSNTAPGNQIGKESNQVNYILDANGFYSVTQKNAVNYSQNYLSAVGSLSGSQSAYGTFDQNGGVWEVISNNKSQNQLYVPLRGGGWTSLASLLQSGYRLGVGTDTEAVNAGFRIVQPATSSNLNPESPSEPTRPPSEIKSEQSDSAKSSNGATTIVELELVTVGDAKNNVDPLTGFGNVDHTFQVSTKPITIGQYTTFLNAVAREDANNLFNPLMQSDLNVAGIQRTGRAGEYQYDVIDNAGSSANRPITYVSWFDAARFANWMANGQPSGIQSRSTTEDGAYSLLVDTTRAPAKNAINPNTGKPSTYYIPSENEWYKAAYFSPALNNSNGGYYLYATQSNVAPVNTSSNEGSNSANLANNFVFYNTQSNVYDPITNYLTDVGFFANSRSHYGTYDQTGLVYQWNDLDSNSSLERGLRGGYWFSAGQSSISSTFNMSTPNRESSDAGFRLAAPEAQWMFDRFIDPLTGIHTFSADSTEIASLQSSGWKEEGYAWSLLPATGGESATIAEVHRLYNPNSKDHLLTLNDAEVTSAKNLGYLYEGVAGRALSIPTSGSSGSTVVQRFFRPSSGEHIYTASSAEAATLPGLGFVSEGSAWMF